MTVHLDDVLAIEGPRPVRGVVRVPGDKSVSHRALMLAAVADGRSTIRNLATGDDVDRTRSAVEAFGIRARHRPSGEVRVNGGGWGALREPEHVVDCGNSGTGIRLFLGLLAGGDGHVVLTGDASIRRRPMGRVVEPLRRMGAHIDGRDGGNLAPLAVRGATLQGVRHELPVASAQVKSAILLAGLRAEGVTEVVEPAQSRDHTERMLVSLGLPVERGADGVRITAADVPAFDLDVPGDPSSAAFHLVAALVTPDSEVTVEDVLLNPTRVAFVDVLERMGGRIAMEVTGESGGEPVGRITASSSVLHGTEIAGDEIPRVIDEIPAIAVAAAFASGDTEVRDAAELRVKETDRIGAVEQELSQMGIAVEVRADGFTVRGGSPRAGQFKSHGDHRIAMAAAVAANACPGQSVVKGWRAVASSYPGFGDDFASLLPAR
ncbi:MAG TPA: 3-phosphoshikimate 1-carboxyvinyltransferase [Acidimicrobiia bacterium]|nr:3-phosphoshikimate 1-carboxyvinyltransferase [Acidimicrobiia bacterium]